MAKGKDNASENIADYVAELLRQGRAKEVTDDLMAQADPQRLYQHYTSGNTGMNLPMDYASRMERAAKMGYTAKATHGTGAQISHVDPQYFGHGRDLLGSGFYTTGNPNRAERYVPREKTSGTEISKNYIEGGNTLPVMLREPKPFNLAEPLGNTANDIASLYSEDPFYSVHKSSSGMVHINDADGKSVSLDPAQPKHWALQRLREGFGPSETSNALSALGYSGVNGPESGGSSVKVSYNPEDVRSQFARFDPRLEHLAHLSASTGGAMDFARHVEAIHRAGGQIAPSKYLLNVPRQVHAGGGRVYPLDDRSRWYGDVNYQQTGGKLVMMSPDEYLSKVRPLDIDEASRDNIDDLKNHILSGRKLDPLKIDAKGREDGRHRAHAARELGIKQVPVLTWPNDPDITKAAGGEVDDEGITAYHGSPHSFDKFDMSKIGTGEGNQTYGHGLYFAGNEKTAKHYRDLLSGGFSLSHKRVQDLIEQQGGDEDAAKKWIDNAIQNTQGGTKDFWEKTLLNFDNLKRNVGGHMYKVKINAGPHELLDWDKPLSEQHPNVQAVLRSFGAKPEDTGAQAYMRAGTHRFAIMGPNGKWGPGGATHEESLSQTGGDPSKVRSIFDGSPQARSAGLLQQGIKGIKYRDAGSRDLSDGDPTHNYVMFHHDPVQVVDKYEYGGTVGKEEGGALGSGNDIQRSRVQELIDKHGGDDQAAKEYLRTSLPSIPASSQDFWQKTLDNFDYLKTPKPVQQVATPVAQENARLGNPEYSTGHTAPHPEKGCMMHDLDAVFPDIATNGWQYYGTGADYDHESFSQISRVNGRPNASVQIYRSVPKDIDKPKINAGDWVTTSPSYAKEHGEAHLGNKYKILKKTVRADELATNGDSIHEWGYWPKTEKASGGAVDAALALTRRFTKDGKGTALSLKKK